MAGRQAGGWQAGRQAGGGQAAGRPGGGAPRRVGIWAHALAGSCQQPASFWSLSLTPSTHAVLVNAPTRSMHRLRSIHRPWRFPHLVCQLDAIYPLHRQHPPGGGLPLDLGYPHPWHVSVQGPKPLCAHRSGQAGRQVQAGLMGCRQQAAWPAAGAPLPDAAYSARCQPSPFILAPRPLPSPTPHPPAFLPSTM